MQLPLTKYSQHKSLAQKHVSVTNDKPKSLPWKRYVVLAAVRHKGGTALMRRMGDGMPFLIHLNQVCESHMTVKHNFPPQT